MKTYEIWKCTKEFPYKEREGIIEGCTIPDEEPEIISVHESLTEAEAALEEYSTTARTYSGGAGKYIGVTEYCIVSTTQTNLFSLRTCMQSQRWLKWMR